VVDAGGVFVLPVYGALEVRYVVGGALVVILVGTALVEPV